jgi:signal transduction histidine kinase/ActR/RegA family two-component response regulator
MPAPVSLDDVITTDVLEARPDRPRDFRQENEILQALALGLADSDRAVLDRLVNAAIQICNAGSAGLSLHASSDAGEPLLKWEAVAGEYTRYLGGTLPLFSPCGVCLDRGRAELFARPERVFTYFSDVRPEIVEALVIPLRADGRNLGTIWIASHVEGQEFSAADLSIMTTVANFTAAALVLRSRERSARTAAERERVERERAERANRVKDEFLSTISHELRTPLHAILSWSELLLEGLPAADAQDAAASIHRNATRQVHLVDDLLDSSRFLAGGLRMDLQPMDVRELVTAVIDGARPAIAAKHLCIRLENGPGATRVTGDGPRLHQAIANVVSNAVKFSDPGSTIAIEIESGAGQVLLRISDAGVGMASEFLPLLFERFTQADASTSRRQGGLGLGLAITRSIIAAHGGAIDGSSLGPGRGATFTLTLPLAHGVQEQVPIAEPPGAALPNVDGARILIVDDDADAREILAKILGNRRARVWTAGSAAEALALLARDLPDVVLTDIGMPYEDGFSLLKRMREHDDPRVRSIPAIAVTAYSSQEDQQRVRRAGFHAHVTKPVLAADLVRKIAQLLSGVWPADGDRLA